MKNKLHILFLLGLFSFGFSLQAQKEAFKKEILVKDGDTLQYRILYPENFSEEKQYPLMLFLHGAGERGSDNEKQLVHGSNLFLDSTNQKKFPAVVVFPQCPRNSYWANADVDRSGPGVKLKFKENAPPTWPMELVIGLVDSLKQDDYIKKDQIYVGGLSMGGMGTFEILSRRPDTFAAAFAICGGGSTSSASMYAKNTPMWVFHGAKDDVVNPKHSLEMVEALLDAGAYPQFTLYNDANHNSWDSAFAEPNLLPWLFSHQLMEDK